MHGLLLINLGTPASPEPRDVGRYLLEFLMDPFVVDIPFPLRWFLVHVLIVPRRSHASSLLYKKIWTEKGSPLLFHSQDLARKVQAALPAQRVVLGMRYGEPSIHNAVMQLQSAGCSEITAFPLYPQYSTAATESSLHLVRTLVRQKGMALREVPPFYDKASYLDAVVTVSRPHLDSHSWDRVLFSFHGLPERQVKKTDPTGAVCLVRGGCCDAISKSNENCYRAQSYATARDLAKRLSLREDQYLVGFQSRLGRTPWIRPYTDEYYRTLPGQGVKRIVVISPSFTADCLETIEEIELRGRDEFLRHGGESLHLIPSLNSDAAWVEAVIQLAAADYQPNT